MKRGELAKLTACNIETIRYYEQIGLLPNPPRSMNGHRVYDEELKRRLIFIIRSRALGFSTAELKGLLTLVDKHKYTCGEVQDLTKKHLETVRQKISDLQNLENSLDKMISKCSGGGIPECPIIDELLSV